MLLTDGRAASARSDRPVAIRTLFVEHSGLPGGGQLGLARFLRSDAGAAAAVAVLGPGPAFDDLPPERVIRLGEARSRLGLARSAVRLRNFIASARPEAVVANSPRAGALLAVTPRVAGASYFYYLRVDVNRSKTSTLNWLLLTRVILPRFHGYLANSRFTESTIPARLARRPRRVAYPVSGTDRLMAIPPIDRGTDRPFTVLSLSRVVAWKGVHVLVDAMTALNKQGLGDHVRAVIAGGTFHEADDYSRRLIARATAEVPNVSFVGHQDDIDGLLSCSDAVVSSSLVAEPFGQVVAQGLAAGRPVIATELGGPLELISDGRNGLLVPAGDAEALATALRALIEDAPLATSIGRAARESATPFADDRTTSSLAGAIRELRDETAGSRRTR